jgi:hypothetical protein
VERQREEDRAVAEAVIALLRAAATANHSAGGRNGEKPDPVAACAEQLRTDLVLLAAVFQNIDLLYRDGYPHADAVSEIVMRALASLPSQPTGVLRLPPAQETESTPKPDEQT